MVDAFLEWVASLPAAAIYALLALLSAVENVFPPVPADVAVVLGAFLAREGSVSAPVLGVLCWAANTVSSAGMYFYARTHGRRFFQSGWPRRFMPPEAIAALEEMYDKHGGFGIFVSRFLPGVRAAVTPFAGVAGLSAPRALIPAATASAIWYAFLIGAGTVLAQSWARARALVEDANRVLALVALVAAGLLAVYVWRRARHHRARSRAPQ